MKLEIDPATSNLSKPLKKKTSAQNESALYFTVNHYRPLAVIKYSHSNTKGADVHFPKSGVAKLWPAGRRRGRVLQALCYVEVVGFYQFQ